MLRNPKKQVLIQAEPAHVEVFIEHYELLKRWALQFTEHDRDLAEDLLHDTFIHFTLSKPNLESVENMEGYLFVVMRNLHLSQLRRATRTPLRSFAAVEYDTADMSFWASDPRDHLRMRDELSAVCQFACLRKESSKGGSLLILRFFHGYYPEEIALILHTTRNAVNAGLKKIRAEAKLYIEEPKRLGFLGEKGFLPKQLPAITSGGDLGFKLRRLIFDSRQGECLSEETLFRFYKPENEGPDRQALAHIVSCQACIESINSLLGLPPLANRYPLDQIGKDPGKKGGSGGSAGGAGGDPNMLESYIRRRDEHYHHEPKELCISVNGQFQGLQKIVSGTGEFVLVLDTNESLGFVEVFSELGLRLLMLNVEPPPSGSGKQSAKVELSSGRIIEANLDFSGRFPTLQVTYNDPTVDVLVLSKEVGHEDAFPIHAQDEQIGITPLPGLLHSVRRSNGKDSVRKAGDLFNGVMGKIIGARWRLSLVYAALFLAVVGLVAWFAISPSTSISADEILNESERRTAIWENQPDKVLHWGDDVTFINHPGGLPDGKYISLYWQNNKNETVSRLNRLYDANGVLVLAMWRRTDGSEVYFRRSGGGEIRITPTRDVLLSYAASLDEKSRQTLENYVRSADEVWQISAGRDLAIKQKYINQSPDRGSVQIIQTPGVGKVFQVRQVTGEDNPVRIEEIDDVAADSFRILRSHQVNRYPDGKTAITDLHSKFYQESSVEDFDRHDLRAEMQQARRIVQVTPQEVLKDAMRIEGEKRNYQDVK
jgi:RNA polymerase sigma factor (sigma-70 family)